MAELLVGFKLGGINSGHNPGMTGSLEFPGLHLR